MKTHVYLRLVLLAILAGCASSKKLTDTSNPESAKPYPVATKSDSLLGMLTKYRTCYDIYYEDLNISLNPDKKTIKGNEKIYSSVTSDFDTLQLDLYKNFTIDNILLNDSSKLNYYRVENSVFIKMPRKLKTGEKFFINFYYNGAPHVAVKAPWDGGFVWSKDKSGNPWIGVACEGEGPGIWRPAKDHNYDEPDSASVNITVKQPLVGASNGVLRETIVNKDSTRTFRWFTSYSINNYNITVYAGNFVTLEDTLQSISGNVVPITYYILPEDMESAKRQFVQAKPILHFYETVFGEYPWQRDGYKLIDSPFEGMEHQSAIAYGSGFKNLFEGGWDYIILHETAHEWWGNSITAFDLAEGWLHEGFATYAECLYIEKEYPGKEYPYMLFMRSTIKNVRPVIGPPGRKFFYDPKVDSDLYMKGAWILHSLRAYLDNDSLFFDILKTFQSRYREKIVTSKDFTDLANEKSGEDLNWFFDQYLKSRFVPVLEVCVSQGGLYYRWTQTNANFKMPVKVKVSDTEEIKITPTAKTQFLNRSMPSISISIMQALMLVKENKELPLLYRGQKAE